MTPYLSMQLFKRVTHIDLQDVPYKGNPQIIADLMPGRISAAILSAASIIGPARSGKIKVLAEKTGTSAHAAARHGFQAGRVKPRLARKVVPS
ncbi:MAG: hypothetical protein ACKVQK_04240 [Burkholderiales bacterium]